MNLLESVARHLDAVGLVSWDPPADVFLDHMPQTPDQAVAVTGYGGVESDAGGPWDHPRIQIRVRGGADPRISYDRCQTIYDALHGLSGVELPGGALVADCIGLQSSPQHLQRDQNNRHEHVVNFELDVLNPARAL